jgi:V8-like Glu-specific endopeptidase
MSRKPSLPAFVTLVAVASSLTAACESAPSTSEPERVVRTVDGVPVEQTIRVLPNGRELLRTGDVRRVQRIAVAPPVTDEEIAAIEDARIERRAVRDGLIGEAPSGQWLDPAGKQLAAVVSDFDDGEYTGAPVEGHHMAELRAAYDASRPAETGEGAVAGESREVGFEVAYKSVRGADGRSRKTTAERADFPFSAILEYQIPMSEDVCEEEGLDDGCYSSCTATLIDPTHATTAAHCVYSRSDDAWIYADDGTRGQVCNASGCVDVVSRHKSGSYATTLFSDFSEDYAVLDLDASPPGYNGDFALSVYDMDDKSTLKSKTHYNYGYPGDKEPFGLWGMSCSIDYVGDDRLGYACDTTGGHSGGPVYYRNGDTRYQTGIHAGAAVFHNTGPNIGEIRDWIISLL